MVNNCFRIQPACLKLKIIFQMWN